jgi:C-terminal processing protease CtpA/Prc
MNEEHFDISLYAIFGSPDFFDIEFLYDDKIEKERCKSIKQITKKKYPNYSFNVLNDSIGFVDMNRMNSYPDFKKFCKSTFKSLKKKKIKYLIIDFRGNGGGDSQIGDELIKYLSDVPFIQYQKAVIKVSAVSRDIFHYPFEKDTLIVKGLADLYENMIQPYSEKKRFSGKVYVLIDGGTYSSAGSTVWCIDHYDLATTIGNETGGTGIHYGYPIKRKLLNTGLSYFISHMKWYQIGADDTSYHGLFPDYKIDLSIEDIINKKDTALNLALELISHE